MKKIIFISALILFGFSCKKQRLKDEKEIFIGKWQLEFATEQSCYKNRCSKLDTIYPSSPVLLTFNKKGEVILEINEETVEYKMNFRA